MAEIEIDLITESPEETQRLGSVLGRACVGGELFLLTGQLGSGKTCFTQGLAWGLDVEEYAHSPTFVLVNEYQGRLTLYHIDLYRIESVQEAAELGLEEYLQGQGVCAVEWAERAPSVLGDDALFVELADVGRERRRLTFRASGRQHVALLGSLRDAVAEQRR